MKELSIEEKAKAYDEAIEKAKEMYKEGMMPERIEYIFPELKENEDERLRKAIHIYLNWLDGRKDCAPRGEYSIRDMIDWLEKQSTERKQLYVRFGNIPSNEKSKIYRGEEEIGDENGVSVYPAFELNGNIVLGLTLPTTRTTLYTQQHLLEYDNRPCYLVSGDYVGSGTDGEPLIRNISVIKKLDNYRIKEIEKQGEQKRILRFKVGDFVKDTNYKDEPIYEVVYIDSQCYICEYRGKENMGDRAVMHFAFENPNLHLVHKPTDNVEPKFKVGDWLQYRNAKPFLVEEITKQGYVNGDSCLPFNWENEIHLWTIQAAKEGDVLASNRGDIIIAKRVYNCQPYAYCGVNNEEFMISDSKTFWHEACYQPATKEQRDTLMKAMADAGYTFDFEKKELKKIEQNPTDKTEPRFKVEKGKWYVCIKDLFDNYANKAFCKGEIYLCTQDGRLIPSNSNVPYEVTCPDTYFRDWTIQDAKNGDVLSTDVSVFIYAKVLYNKPYAYCGVNKFGFFKANCLEHDWANSVDNVHPANKEQRDLLFTKMKEVGYKWDAEKKELKKIEQNPAWGEEDELMLTSTVNTLKLTNGAAQMKIDWLKSLKDRIQPQPKQE